MKRSKTAALCAASGLILALAGLPAQAEDWDQLVKDVKEQNAHPQPTAAAEAAKPVAEAAPSEEHPRIAAAIRELEDAIAYMEAAPHNFGGNKARAIADARKAVASLRRALAFRGAAKH